MARKKFKIDLEQEENPKKLKAFILEQARIIEKLQAEIEDLKKNFI